MTGRPVPLSINEFETVGTIVDVDQSPPPNEIYPEHAVALSPTQLTPPVKLKLVGDGVGVLLGYGVIVGVGVGVLVGVIVGVTVFVGVGVGLGKQLTPVFVNTNVGLS